jgi:ketosteroid isomerase-like protein
LKQIFKTCFVVLTLAAMVGCNGQWAPNGGGGGGQGRNRPHATEDEVKQQFEKLMGAFARRDINGVNEMMASNATFINVQVGPGVYSWADARPMLEQAFSRGAYQLANDSAYRIGVNRDLGWIATVYHVRVPTKTGVAQVDGGISVLFQKNPDGYKVLLLHTSHFPQLVQPGSTQKPLDRSGKAK